MNRELKLSFEELPLIVDLGIEGAPVNGTATIGFEDDGDWVVDEITLDGSRLCTPAETVRAGKLFERKPIELCRASYPWLYATITDQLENGRFRKLIDDAIGKELEEAGTSRPDPNKEHSTLNRVQQGV